ncbi:MAG: response regulator transcription factor [Peptococcaceae bacterium]|jgi:two-component system response regulator MprA|nr:response regulator transcription factor [Peptococcaceae bacterium]
MFVLEANKILVIDDDPKIRSMLQRSLSYSGYRVFTAEDGIMGWDIAQKEKPDLIILDIMLPEMNGYEFCQHWKKFMDTPVLMLTARDEVKDRVRGLDCGADDYLVKPFALEELLARVRALLRRFRKNNGLQLKFGDLEVNPETYQVRRGGRDIELTAREFELLLLFMKHPGQVLTREKLMDSVWGYGYEGESNVLEVYIGYLRSKLEEAGEKRIIHTVRGVGYVLKE